MHQVRSKAHIPIGIKVLMTYSGILILFYLFFGLVMPLVLRGTPITTSPYLLFSNCFAIIALSIMIYGFSKRKTWSWKLALFMYAFSILNSIIMLAYIKYSVLTFISDFVKSSFIFTLFLNILTIWYVYERKDYFMKGKYNPHIHTADKIFISTVYVFYFFAIIFVIALGFEFYKSATYTVDEIANDLRGKTYEQSINFCNNMDANLKSADRDVCYLSVAAVHDKFQGSRTLCNYIYSDFYKLACYQATS